MFLLHASLVCPHDIRRGRAADERRLAKGSARDDDRERLERRAFETAVEFAVERRSRDGERPQLRERGCLMSEKAIPCPTVVSAQTRSRPQETGHGDDIHALAARCDDPITTLGLPAGRGPHRPMHALAMELTSARDRGHRQA
ncbi:MAG TPA: hypothetical protein VFV53_00395, partial [Candidatus Limnocylindrales bacterium]|nr:hypothetical protein [Candidatus Limnocylindrales bacterium]